IKRDVIGIAVIGINEFKAEEIAAGQCAAPAAHEFKRVCIRSAVHAVKAADVQLNNIVAGAAVNGIVAAVDDKSVVSGTAVSGVIRSVKGDGVEPVAAGYRVIHAVDGNIVIILVRIDRGVPVPVDSYDIHAPSGVHSIAVAID